MVWKSWHFADEHFELVFSFQVHLSFHGYPQFSQMNSSLYLYLHVIVGVNCKLFIRHFHASFVNKIKRFLTSFQLVSTCILFIKKSLMRSEFWQLQNLMLQTWNLLIYVARWRKKTIILWRTLAKIVEKIKLTKLKYLITAWLHSNNPSSTTKTRRTEACIYGSSIITAVTPPPLLSRSLCWGTDPHGLCHHTATLSKPC